MATSFLFRVVRLIVIIVISTKQVFPLRQFLRIGPGFDIFSGFGNGKLPGGLGGGHGRQRSGWIILDKFGRLRWSKAKDLT